MIANPSILLGNKWMSLETRKVPPGNVVPIIAVICGLTIHLKYATLQRPSDISEGSRLRNIQGDGLEMLLIGF